MLNIISNSSTINLNQTSLVDLSSFGHAKILTYTRTTFQSVHAFHTINHKAKFVA